MLLIKFQKYGVHTTKAESQVLIGFALMLLFFLVVLSFFSTKQDVFKFLWKCLTIVWGDELFAEAEGWSNGIIDQAARQ